MPQTNPLDFSTPAAGEKSLKTISQQLARAGQPVVTSEFNQKPKRTSDTTYREAYVTFASGQQVTLRVNTTGDIYQVLLNNTLKPLKEQTDTGQAIAEIAGFVTKNQAAFQKAQARKQVALPKGMTTPKPKVLDALALQSAELDTQIAERRTRLSELEKALGAMTDSANLLDSAINDLTTEAIECLRVFYRFQVVDASALSSSSGLQRLIELGFVEIRGDVIKYNAITESGTTAADELFPTLKPGSAVGVEAISWLGFKVVNEQFVLESGPMPVPSRFQVGADVRLVLEQNGGSVSIQAKVLGANFRASKVHYTLGVPVDSVGNQKVYAVLHDVDSDSVSSDTSTVLDASSEVPVISSLVPYMQPSAVIGSEMPLASAYVAARELVAASGLMLDDASTADAKAHLQIGLDVVETNGPISLEEGNLDQARLELRMANSFRAAMAMLDSANARPLDDSSLAQLVLIAKADAATEDEIADQDALATLLVAGLVDVLEGVYFVAERGRQYLNDNGMDAYGEPFDE